jgi:hypothetical protein
MTPASSPRILSIAWIDVTAPEVKEDGYGPRHVPLQTLLGDDWNGIEPTRQAGQSKPTWVYYFRGGDDVLKREAAEEKMFSDAQVVYASRFFRCIRVDVDRLAKDDPVRDQIEGFPAFAFQDLNGKTVTRISGTMPPGHLFNRLHDAYKVQFAGDLKARIARYVQVVDELELAEARSLELRAYISELEYQLSERKSAANQREIEKAQKQLAAAQARSPS